MRFGAVIFDDAFRKKTGAGKAAKMDGWASIEGAAPRRIVSVSELESDVKWWTNFDFTNFNSYSLGREPNIYFSGFLRTDMSALAYEMGCGVEESSADRSCSLMATMFSRVMNIAINTLQVDVNCSAMGTKSLCDLIAAKTINKYKIPDELNSALEHAHQAWTQIPMRLPKNWRSATLRSPRYTHAIEILSTPVPGEQRWTYVNSSRLPDTNNTKIDWCLVNELPVLVNVVVTPRRNEYTELIAFNGGATKSRSWVCQPELLFLSQFCDIEVIGAFVCDGGYQKQKELDAFPSLGDYSLASYSLGVIAENFWISLGNARANVFGKKFFPPRAVWYRAMDRISMFMSAAKLKADGFGISGYGNGQVLVLYPAGATEELISAANEYKMDVPASKYNEVRTEVRLLNDE